jgi:hypothetical protein
MLAGKERITMQPFVLKGTMVFEAEGIEEALTRLGNHFLKVAAGEKSDLLLPGSDVSINQAVYAPTERECLSRQLHNIFTAGTRDIDIDDGC